MRPAVSKYVLDASALLALLQREPGHLQVAKRLGDTAISTVNLCEVASKLMERGLPRESVGPGLLALDLDIVPFDEALAFRAAELRSSTRRFGLSLADRACLATAEAFQATALTTDRSWSRLKLNAGIEIVR